MTKLGISIVLPTYNERENIRILIPGIVKTFGHINHEIIIVDDSSPDGTAKAAEELSEEYDNIKVIVRKKKVGIGAAIREGYNSAKNSIILSSDSDLSFTLSDMYRFYEKILEGYDLVWGSKYSKGSFYEPETLEGRIKKLVSKSGNEIIRFATGIDAYDFTANLRSVRKDVWKQIRTQEKTNTFLMEMILKCKYGGFRVTEMPVTFNARIHGESKMNLAVEAPKFIIKMVKYVLMYRFTGYKLMIKDDR